MGRINMNSPKTLRPMAGRPYQHKTFDQLSHGLVHGAQFRVLKHPTKAHRYIEINRKWYKVLDPVKKPYEVAFLAWQDQQKLNAR